MARKKTNDTENKKPSGTMAPAESASANQDPQAQAAPKGRARSSRAAAGDRNAAPSAENIQGETAASTRRESAAMESEPAQQEVARNSSASAGEGKRAASAGAPAADTADGDYEEAVRRRAFEIYQQRGGQHGLDQDDWFRAEQEVSARYGRKSA